jgi:hypothetical protein
LNFKAIAPILTDQTQQSQFAATTHPWTCIELIIGEGNIELALRGARLNGCLFVKFGIIFNEQNQKEYFTKMNRMLFAILCWSLEFSALAAAEEWQRLFPNEPGSDELDLESLKLTSPITYTGRYRDHEFSMDSYRLSSINVPHGSYQIHYIKGQCADGATSAETQLDLVSPEGKVIQSDKPNEDMVAMEMELNDRYLKGTYQQNMASFACAALAARCTRRDLQWPLKTVGAASKPDDKNPLYGWMENEGNEDNVNKESVNTSTTGGSVDEQVKTRQLYVPNCKADFLQQK